MAIHCVIMDDNLLHFSQNSEEESWMTMSQNTLPGQERSG